LNALTPEAAQDALAQCCGSSRWIALMLAQRPFANTPALFDAAREIWHDLGREDRIEAFQQHPRMGESLSELAKRDPRAARTAAREQGKVLQADRETLRVLHEQNQRYFERFGHTLIVSAAGKSAQDILTSLQERLAHDPARELDEASEEQMKITALRLARLA
jgi:OHCU decarboxylase